MQFRFDGTTSSLLSLMSDATPQTICIGDVLDLLSEYKLFDMRMRVEGRFDFREPSSSSLTMTHLDTDKASVRITKPEQVPDAFYNCRAFKDFNVPDKKLFFLSKRLIHYSNFPLFTPKQADVYHEGEEENPLISIRFQMRQFWREKIEGEPDREPDYFIAPYIFVRTGSETHPSMQPFGDEIAGLTSSGVVVTTGRTFDLDDVFESMSSIPPTSYKLPKEDDQGRPSKKNKRRRYISFDRGTLSYSPQKHHEGFLSGDGAMRIFGDFRVEGIGEFGRKNPLPLIGSPFYNKAFNMFYQDSEPPTDEGARSLFEYASDRDFPHGVLGLLEACSQGAQKVSYLLLPGSKKSDEQRRAAVAGGIATLWSLERFYSQIDPFDPETSDFSLDLCSYPLDIIIDREMKYLAEFYVLEGDSKSPLFTEQEYEKLVYKGLKLQNPYITN